MKVSMTAADLPQWEPDSEPRQRGRAARVDVNRIYRLYCEEDLSVRKRKARRRGIGTRAPMLVEEGKCPLISGLQTPPIEVPLH